MHMKMAKPAQRAFFRMFFRLGNGYIFLFPVYQALELLPEFKSVGTVRFCVRKLRGGAPVSP